MLAGFVCYLRTAMTNEQQRLKKHFLEAETRSGHYISAEMKACWKAMLDMVEEVDRICRKHHIKYFLIAGTLLGAIRHRGFIPWDDDIDIALFRDDYDKLERILPEELPSNMFMQTLATDQERLRSKSGRLKIANAITWEYSLIFSRWTVSLKPKLAKEF